MVKQQYVVPKVAVLGTVTDITAITNDSARVDENEATGMTGMGSFDICYLGTCTPTKGDRRG